MRGYMRNCSSPEENCTSQECIELLKKCSIILHGVFNHLRQDQKKWTRGPVSDVGEVNMGSWYF